MRILNKRAKYEYNLTGDRVEAGIVLSGGEAKAIRTGHIDLSQSVARVLNGELWLINANVPVTGAKDYNSTRSRKLLLHRSEIISLGTKVKQQKLTVVPLSVYNKKRLIKVKLVLGKLKRKFEKKEAIKRKDIDREIVQVLKNQSRLSRD